MTAKGSSMARSYRATDRQCWTRCLLPHGIRRRLVLLLVVVLLPVLLCWSYYNRYQMQQAQEFQNELEVARVVVDDFKIQNRGQLPEVIAE